MQPNQDKIERLHQEAAAFYLQGDFEKALGSWQKLLSIDAEDERAQEGKRLCEMLAQEGEMPGPSSLPIATPEDDLGIEQSAYSAPAPTPPVVPAVQAVQAVQAVEAPPPPTFDQLDDEDLGWDLSKLDLAGDPPAALPDAASAAQAAGLDSLGAALATPAATIESAASCELRARLDELLRQATAAWEAGDSANASSILSRVFILDDAHPGALNLQQAIQQAATPPPEPELDLDLDLDLDLPDPGTGDVFADDLGPPPPLLDDLATRPDPADIPMRGLGENPLPAGVREAQRQAAQAAALAAQAEAAQAEAAQAVPAAPGRSRAAVRLSPRFVAMFVVGLIVVLAAGWGALKFVGRSSDPGLDEAVRRMQALDKSDVAAAAGNESGKTNRDDAVLVQGVPDDLPAVLARAEAALEGGEFSQAIIAYNRALEIDPGHVGAKAGLELAGAGYREQNAYRQKMDLADAAWERGDFRAAMRIFYRLPEAEGNPRFDRYKRDGWYNLGVQALKGGECEDARAHFEELRTFDPVEREFPALLDLAKNCGFSSLDPQYRESVDALELRGLEIP